MQTSTPHPSLLVATSADSQYGLFAPLNQDGLHELWRLANKNSRLVGYVANPDQLEAAVEAAEQEMRELMAEAAAEFG